MSKHLQTVGTLILLYLFLHSDQSAHQLRFTVIFHPFVEEGIFSAKAVFTGNSRVGFLQNPNPM